MSVADAFWHLLNLFATAAMTGALAAAGAKLLWRRTLASVPWHRLALWAMAACSVVTLGGLLTSTFLNLIVVPAGYSLVFGYDANSKKSIENT